MRQPAIQTDSQQLTSGCLDPRQALVGDYQPPCPMSSRYAARHCSVLDSAPAAASHLRRLRHAASSIEESGYREIEPEELPIRTEMAAQSTPVPL